MRGLLVKLLVPELSTLVEEGYEGLGAGARRCLR
jgi:hypothetical protein